MNFPEDFVKRVKEEFPNSEFLHEALDKGDKYTVDRCINDSLGLNMEAPEIIKAFDEGRENEVKKAAEKWLRRDNLLLEFRKLY